jgi:hypothetical protein
VICRIDAIPTKITMMFFTEIEKKIVHVEAQKTLNNKSNPE